ncbi:uridine kinase [Kibdelosporangium aridum]|uniref:Uridine kinase n=1 Tax=Kibdelosporangium aridum TaxID=2030 RepID=A0A428Z7V3_KIBAR|nr:uridine kinase [Kibdelosporangium aridum]RSM83887.1 uridine kinase [Kibdelosporangium aridum]
MRFQPVSFAALAEYVVSRITAVPGRMRVVVDGAPAAGPGDLADALIDPLRVLGRQVIRVRADDFLRPASLRFEHGKTDEESRYSSWLDEGALRREVLTGDKVLPSLWNAATDRATRADYVPLPPGGVVVVDGELLLGRGLPFDLAVHLWLSPAALARRTPADDAWSLPVFARYDAEVDPLTTADVAVRFDDPQHPAMRVD